MPYYIGDLNRDPNLENYQYGVSTRICFLRACFRLFKFVGPYEIIEIKALQKGLVRVLRGFHAGLGVVVVSCR